MSKNKKHPVTTGKLSPVSYVKTQARTLPILECLVSDDWEGSGIGSILIIRGHKTGNVTVGIYLVDLYCLGLKDTSYRFNISPGELNYYVKNADMIKCDYVLAHNIIYGAIEYAADYGFNPHKDFTITRFILEDDDEDVELMDIEFGLDGMPCYFRGPHDNDARVNFIRATLESNAGPGNYNIVDTDGAFDIDEDDVLEDEDEQVIELFNSVSEKYDRLIRSADANERLDNMHIGMEYEVTGEPIDSEYVNFDSDEERESYVALYQKLGDTTQLKRTIRELEKAVKTYPGKPVFYNLLQSAYLLDDEQVKSDAIIYEMMRLFPGYLYAKVSYANLMLDEGRLNEAIATFNGARDLDELYPARHIFHESEVAAFWGTMCRYYIKMHDIDAADAYMTAILRHKVYAQQNQTILFSAISALYVLKFEKLKESGLLDLE